MTETTLASPSPGGRRPAPLGRLRAVLRVAAVVSCVPYVTLKIAWISGSRIGIPDGSVLLDHPGLVAAANGVTVLMDAVVVVLALLLTQEWGRRVPAWLLAVPMWVATGLLTPIVTGFPLQLLVKVFTGAESAPAHSESFLDEWVFGVVYTGFIVQGLALGTLFVLYARDRWGHLWRGTVRELPGSAVGARLKAAAVVAAVLATLAAVAHVMWAAGATTGLSQGRIDGRTPDFYVLEGTSAVFAALTVAGVLTLALRRRPQMALRTPLALAWVGSGAMGCWGGWLLITSAMPVTDGADRATTLMLLTYAGQVIAGLVILGAGAAFLRRRGQDVRAGGQAERQTRERIRGRAA